MIQPDTGSHAAEPPKSVKAADPENFSTQRALRFSIELRLLNAEISDLDKEQSKLPQDALIQTLFQLAVMRIEERIITLQRINATTTERSIPDFEPTEATRSRLLSLLATAH